VHNLKFAYRSLWRARGLSATVIVTLALGIGANAAIFSLVRAVLLRPLVNRDESRLLYLRQSAPGIGLANATFSVPEIQDLRERVTSLSAIGEFSTVGFTMVGAGEPRQVRAGVVSGNYFEVMGLRPVLGRLLNPADDGAGAAGAAVLTYRFWTTTFQRDPTVLGRAIRLDTRSAVIVGVLEPSVPYPAETELIANVVTSPHHLSATMITGREHRMTETFGRLAPAASLESARTELRQVHSTFIHEHAEAYPPRAAFALNAVRLRDELTARARTLLIVLMSASILVFVIACSNVANLLLARTVRRESEFAVRSALGADSRSLRRTLLVESLLLCGSGAILGVMLAASMVSILARYAARFSARALDVQLDVPFLAVAVILALMAAVLLAFVPRLPSGDRPGGLRLSSGSVRISGATSRRLNLFAITQIGASFVLLAGAAVLLHTFLTLQAASPGFATARVLAINVPVTSYGRTRPEIREFYRQVQTRIGALPGVERVAVGSMVPWRDRGGGGSGRSFQIEGGTRGGPGDDPRARFRSVSPGFFASLGVPVSAGRDFTADDVDGGERVVIVSQSVADQLFPGREVINRHLLWTDSIMKFIGVSAEPRRIVGVVPDIDDERIVPGPALTVYHPFEQEVSGGRVFVHTGVDPYSLVPNITRIVRDLASDQPVEQAATLDDVRADVIAPDRLNSLVFGIFAAVAVAISVVGVAGVLAFSVSGRRREFGVLKSGALIAVVGIVAGGIVGLVGARLAAGFLPLAPLPGLLPIAAAAALLLIAALVAALIPAARAARVDVIRALRTE
jgi:putative ABC transport system permease protein